jgi:hypothetical protein
MRHSRARACHAVRVRGVAGARGATGRGGRALEPHGRGSRVVAAGGRVVQLAVGHKCAEQQRDPHSGSGSPFMFDNTKQLMPDLAQFGLYSVAGNGSGSSANFYKLLDEKQFVLLYPQVPEKHFVES